MKRSHSLRDDVTALYLVQGVRYMLPLFLVPVLARRLGPDTWGRLALAQTLIVYLAGVIEFGFQFSATREAARLRHDPLALTNLFAGVMASKIVLASGTALLLPLFGTYVVSSHLGTGLLWASWAAATAQSLSLFWFYQGLELVRRAALLEMGGRILSTALCLQWVRHPADIWLVPSLQAMSSMLVMALEAHGLRGTVTWRWPRSRAIVSALREGRSLFVFRTAINLYAVCNVFVLSCFAPLRLVAFYAGPERLAKAVVSLLQPISQALFPRSSYLAAADPPAATRLGRKALWAMGGLGLVAGTVLHWGASLIIRLAFGPGFEPAVAVLRWLALLSPLIAINMALAVQFMVPQGRDAALTRILLLAGGFNLAAAWWAAPQFGAAGMAITAVLTEALILLATVFQLRGPVSQIGQRTMVHASAPCAEVL